MTRFQVKIDHQQFTVQIESKELPDRAYKVTIDNEIVNVTLPDAPELPGIPEWIILDNQPFNFSCDFDKGQISSLGHNFPVEVKHFSVERQPARGIDYRVEAPIPGLIRQIFVEEGEFITAGQSLMILEAMKMENEVLSPITGRVGKIYAEAGKNVSIHDLLVEIH